MESPMGLRKSDIMACTVILAGAGLGLTTLFANVKHVSGQGETVRVVESSEPHVVLKTLEEKEEKPKTATDDSQDMGSR
jgi:hypothetical protein